MKFRNIVRRTLKLQNSERVGRANLVIFLCSVMSYTEENDHSWTFKVTKRKSQDWRKLPGRNQLVGHARAMTQSLTLSLCSFSIIKNSFCYHTFTLILKFWGSVTQPIPYAWQWHKKLKTCLLIATEHFVIMIIYVSASANLCRLWYISMFFYWFMGSKFVKSSVWRLFQDMIKPAGQPVRLFSKVYNSKYIHIWPALRPFLRISEYFTSENVYFWHKFLANKSEIYTYFALIGSKFFVQYILKIVPQHDCAIFLKQQISQINPESKDIPEE